MKMKKIVISLIIGIVAIFGAIYVFNRLENSSYKSEGENFISKIEDYKKNKGKLPETINDLDESNKEMGEGPYYRKIDESTYNVYFNIGFDNQIIYDSKTKKWKDSP